MVISAAGGQLASSGHLVSCFKLEPSPWGRGRGVGYGAHQHRFCSAQELPEESLLLNPPPPAAVPKSRSTSCALPRPAVRCGAGGGSGLKALFGRTASPWSVLDGTKTDAAALLSMAAPIGFPCRGPPRPPRLSSNSVSSSPFGPTGRAWVFRQTGLPVSGICFA